MKYMKYVQMERQDWDASIRQLEGYPFGYTSDCIEFGVEYSQMILANEAFLLQEGKRVLAVAAIYIEEDENGDRQVSWNGGYCLGPHLDKTLKYKEQEKYAKQMMQHIDEIAEQYQCKEIWLRIDPLTNPKQELTLYNYNFLLRYGYVDHSSLTQLIDLTKRQEELYSDIRKSHKRHIKRGGRYELEFYDSSNISQAQIELYKRIYEEDAGKVTRNSELYMHYLYFIQNGLAVLELAKYKGEYVAALISTCSQKTAYYSSYGELEERLEGIPVGHIMHWHMLLHMKEKGMEYYEMGEQVFGPTHYSSPEKKLIDISSFKRRFGGYTHPFWRGRKIIEKPH